ncbi:alanine racemase [Arenibaculum pallidiluteum]|uniref:alanine racemase n=1 Tax=Arenibaculum pallidiluteum TaxID=2812559 RepID=UPI001A96854F|nr:alanine racemase [Arenibaculum pallidiluteum]
MAPRRGPPALDPAPALAALDPAAWPTPRVIVDRARLAGNIRRVQDIADRAGLRLRPHAKTHKSVAIARQQVSAGAVGVTVAKPGEAQVFVEAGIPSVLLAYPVVEPFRIDALLEAVRGQGTELLCMADRTEGAIALAAAAARHGMELPVLVKVDVGLGRLGVDPAGPAAVDLAGTIVRAPHLRFGGIMSHAGQAYAAPGRDEVAAIAEEERRTMLAVRDRLLAAGLPVPVVSVGSTPTVLAQRDFGGLTEVRPGNSVFLDGTALRLGIAAAAEVALWVLATVVGHGPRHAIVDAGSKVLSSDLGAHGSGAPGYGWAFPVLGGPPLFVERLSEEHGWLRMDGAPPPVGSRVAVLPNHACPVANLTDLLTLVGGGEPPMDIPVDARGRVR